MNLKYVIILLSVNLALVILLMGFIVAYRYMF